MLAQKNLEQMVHLLPFDSTDVGVNVGFGANQNTTSINNTLKTKV